MKRKITFEVDDNKLFDVIRHMRGDMTSIGTRLVEVMLMGDCTILGAVGLAVYGITLVKSKPTPLPNQDPSP